MQKYMTHPKHGGKLVYLDDFEQKQKEGWVFGEEPKEEETKPILKPVKQNIIYETIKLPQNHTDTLEVAYEKKFGKKPHHRMSQENIKKALE